MARSRRIKYRHFIDDKALKGSIKIEQREYDDGTWVQVTVGINATSDEDRRVLQFIANEEFDFINDKYSSTDVREEAKQGNVTDISYSEFGLSYSNSKYQNIYKNKIIAAIGKYEYAIKATDILVVRIPEYLLREFRDAVGNSNVSDRVRQLISDFLQEKRKLNDTKKIE
jgi:hypothetical protein